MAHSNSDTKTNTLLSLPFEIRARIWQYAKPDSRTLIPCCECIDRHVHPPPDLPCQQRPRPEPATPRCLAPFAALLSALDPLDIAHHDTHILAREQTFVFCSAACFSQAFRLATATQRAFFTGSRVRINFTRSNVSWIRSDANGESQKTPASMELLYDGEPSEKEYEEMLGVEDAESRIWWVYQFLAMKLRGVLGKGDGAGRTAMGVWNAREVGEGWVEMGW